MGLFQGARLRYLISGALLRLVLLAFGLFQDTHSSVPYTDVDYSVFVDGARNLVQGCPLHAAVPSRSDARGDLEELLTPPLAPYNGCSKGWLSVVARYILQHEEILVARSHGKLAEKMRQDAPEDEEPFLTMSEEPTFIDTHMLPMSLAVLKPLLKPLAATGNPYARPTYRYTPLLASLLGPGALVGGFFERVWGKILFILADLIAAILMWDISLVRSRAAEDWPDAAPSRLSVGLRSSLRQRLSSSLSDATHSVGLLWLLNPFPAQIATRGSCESVVSVLVLAFASAAVRVVEGGSSLAVVSESSVVASTSVDGDQGHSETAMPERVPGALPALPMPVLATPIFLALAVHMKIFPIIYGVSVLSALLSVGPRRWLDALAFAGSAAYVFLGLNTFVWLVWGEPYIRESIKYHITRIDHRHNFSPYFLPLYLLYTPAADGSLPDLPGSESAAKLSSFIPQLIVVAWIGIRVARHDLIMAFGAQTMAFVVWNKVSTSQVRTLWVSRRP